MLHVEIIGTLAEDAKLETKETKKYLVFTVEHHEGTQYLYGHKVPIVCKMRIHEYTLLHQLKKHRRVLVKGDFLVKVNNGRYGDGSTTLGCRVAHIELI